MLDFFLDMAMFGFKVLVIVIAISVIIGIIVSVRASRKPSAEGAIEIINISDQLQEQQHRLTAALLDKKDYKLWKKQQKQETKAASSASKKSRKAGAGQKKSAGSKAEATASSRVFVVDFAGDIKASQTTSLACEITAIIQLATKKDEVVLRLESPGGMVHGYGLASSQLQRLHEHKISLTVCIDKVAASGGYMMACMGSKIMAAPFAVVGSIGVVGQIPNFNKLLKNWKIDYEQHTSGKYKRTLTMLGENTAEGRKKFRQELDTTHKLFKDMVQARRPALNITKVSTGEIWYGQQAVDMKLVDGVMTSDEYLYALSESKPVYHIAFKQKKTLPEKLGISISTIAEHVLAILWQKDQEQQVTRNG